MRYDAVFSEFLHLHLIVRFSYFMHLHLIRSIWVQCGLMWCSVGAVLWFGLDSFGPDWASPNVNFNLKNLFLQLKNLTNYSLQHTNINVFNLNLNI